MTTHTATTEPTSTTAPADTEPTSTTAPADTTTVSVAFTDTEGWQFRGAFTYETPEVIFAKDISTSPPGQAKVKIQFDSHLVGLPGRDAILAELPAVNPGRTTTPALVDGMLYMQWPHQGVSTGNCGGPSGHMECHVSTFAEPRTWTESSDDLDEAVVDEAVSNNDFDPTVTINILRAPGTGILCRFVVQPDKSITDNTCMDSTIQAV